MATKTSDKLINTNNGETVKLTNSVRPKHELPNMENEFDGMLHAGLPSHVLYQDMDVTRYT